MKSKRSLPTWARLLILAMAAACAVVAALAYLFLSRPGPPVANPNLAAAPAVEARLEQLPHDPSGEAVRQGYRIFVDTPHYAQRYSGNVLSCGSCHLDAGQRANASPMWAAWGMYPAYLAKSGAVSSFEERIRQCFRFSMNGFLRPPLDSPEVRALAAYAQWLARGQPVGVELPGRGFPAVQHAAADADPQRGGELYGKRCAACHGGDGEGQRQDSGAYLYPPLWGWHSFNKGAGMNRPDLLAAFLKGNMPYGNPDLSDQEALDLAAWITRQRRWPDPRKNLVSGFLDR